ncbi:hypothetical protein AX16_001913 [Volvariella volvacea WC 439]|nr:hypothetical protein AX16_001913 [Volvariella volvacea WC 439]
MDIGIAGRSRRLQLTRVSWTRTAPPTLSVQDIHPILEISACLGDVDAVREEMHQILVGTLMGIETVGPSLRELEKIKSRSQYRPMGFYDHFANILSTVPLRPMFSDLPGKPGRARPYMDDTEFKITPRRGEMATVPIESSWKLAP